MIFGVKYNQNLQEFGIKSKETFLILVIEQKRKLIKVYNSQHTLTTSSIIQHPTMTENILQYFTLEELQNTLILIIIMTRITKIIISLLNMRSWLYYVFRQLVNAEISYKYQRLL